MVITFFTSGGEPTLPVRIWGMLRRGIDPSVNAMASIILLTTIAARSWHAASSAAGR